MSEYIITRANGPIDWQKVPALQIAYLHNTPPVDISAQAQICYDDEALHVHLSAVEKNIRAVHTGKLDEVCEDSCLEFFFSPIPSDPRYFNLEVNPNGAMFLGVATEVDNLTRIIPAEWSPIEPVIARTADGWNVTYSIPYAFLRLFFPGFAPKSGDLMTANCFKCGELTDPKHFLCWKPVVKRRCSFHNTACFGTMEFE